MDDTKNILTNLGSGVVGEYSKLDAKLKIFFQIPTLEQLKIFKIDHFNSESSFTSRINGEKITSKTYKIFLENLLKDFTKKEPRKISNFEDVPFSYIETWFREDGLDEFLNDYEGSRLVLYDTFKEVYPSKKIDFVNFNADVYFDHLGSEYCALGLILYVNGWSTELHKEDKDLFVKWEFSFNKKVNELMESLFCRGVESIIDIHQHYREDFIHMMRSPFNLDEYVLYFPHSFLQIFEYKLDPKKIMRKQPLNYIPDYYESVQGVRDHLYSSDDIEKENFFSIEKRREALEKLDLGKKKRLEEQATKELEKNRRLEEQAIKELEKKRRLKELEKDFKKRQGKLFN